jgi:hypothetical protein
MVKENCGSILNQVREARMSANLCMVQPRGRRAMERLRVMIPILLTTIVVIGMALLPLCNLNAETVDRKLKVVPDSREDGPKAELSVSLSDSTFSFGTNLLNSWLAPQTSTVINDGTVAENFVGRISQFTDGSNTWGIDALSNGADSVRAQWSTTSETGPWTGISDYETDFTIATNVAVNDSVTFWFRIQTPTNTSSFNEHSSTLTVTALEY